LLASDVGLSVDANLTLTENAYSDNWTGGEAGAVSWAFSTNSLLEKQLSELLHSKSTLKMAFGQTYSQDGETKAWSPPAKSTDLIDLETILRVTLHGLVDPFVGGRFESQWFDGSDPDFNRYINPIRFTEGAGIARVFIEEESRNLISRLGFVLKQTFDRDVAGLDGGRETVTSNYGGVEFVSDFTTPLAKEQITFTSRLSLFQSILYSKAEELEGVPEEDYWKSLDVDWESIVSANITNYLMVNFYMQLLYDKEIDFGARFKQTLSLGLTYKLTR
jgi:hypothetical protein